MTSSISQVGSSGSQPFHCLCNQVGLYVILSVCEQDYCKSNRSISLKLGVMIGPTNRSNFTLVYAIRLVCTSFCLSVRRIIAKVIDQFH